MKDKEPYQIKGLMLGYNLFQTVFSLWMFLEGEVERNMANLGF